MEEVLRKLGKGERSVGDYRKRWGGGGSAEDEENVEERKEVFVKRPLYSPWVSSVCSSGVCCCM